MGRRLISGRTRKVCAAFNTRNSSVRLTPSTPLLTPLAALLHRLGTRAETISPCDGSTARSAGRWHTCAPLSLVQAGRGEAASKTRGSPTGTTSRAVHGHRAAGRRRERARGPAAWPRWSPGLGRPPPSEIGVEFLNTATGQRLWYHLVSFDSRGLSFRGAWFVNGPSEYIVADTVDVLGQTMLRPGDGGQLYAVEIGSRVQGLLQTGGPDAELGHWKVNGFYSGALTNGNIKIQSTQGLFGLSHDRQGQ